MCLTVIWCVLPSQEEQAAKLKAEKIRVALEKIKEAQVKKVNYLCCFMSGFFFFFFFKFSPGKCRHNTSHLCLLPLRYLKEKRNNVVL